MKKKEKFSIIYFWVIFGLILLTQLMLFPDKPANKALTYKEFIQAVDSGMVSRLVILQDKIIGEYKAETNVTETDTTNHALTQSPSTPWRLRIPSIEKQVARQFIVSRIPDFPDPELLEMLKNSDINFEGRFENNMLRNFFLNWLLPLIFFIAIWATANWNCSAPGSAAASSHSAFYRYLGVPVQKNREQPDAGPWKKQSQDTG